MIAYCACTAWVHLKVPNSLYRLHLLIHNNLDFFLFKPWFTGLNPSKTRTGPPKCIRIGSVLGPSQGEQLDLGQDLGSQNLL